MQKVVVVIRRYSWNSLSNKLFVCTMFEHFDRPVAMHMCMCVYVYVRMRVYVRACVRACVFSVRAYCVRFPLTSDVRVP